MATKPKITKESAPKTTKTTPNALKKSVDKVKKVPAKAMGSTKPELTKSAPSKVKGKTESKPANKEVQRVSLSEPPVKKSKKTAPKLKNKLEQPAPQSSTVEPPANKWREIRSILVKLKENTLHEIKKAVKSGTEAVAAIEPGGDIYDQASSERDRELLLLLGDREREKIHNIDEALLRIDEGEYGICEECDEEIPLGRLKAMPFARHCVKCKSDLEKLQAQTKRVEEERAYREIPLGAEEEES